MVVVGNTVGRYEIRELLGTGAMAEVYKAYDPQIGRIGAIKILKDSLIEETEYLGRFLKEAGAAGTLNHPNIVTVYDVGKYNELPYILMELVGGVTLTDVLSSKPDLSYATIIDIAMQVASALDCAHSAGIVHRDIKPDNILYDAEKNTIKIADFGIAKQENAELAERTLVGTVLGTPRYMSPEQARGEKVDGRADLFSLGVILYELITGHKAFDGKSMATLIIQIMQNEPTPIREYAPDVPDGLQSIINSLLNKKPGKRFQTGRQLYDALAKEQRTLQDQQDEQSYLPMQVRWTAIMGGVVGLVMIASMMVVFNVQRNLLTDQAIGAGASLATAIASESSTLLLAEDWIGLETLTDEGFKRKSFDALTVVDHSSVVRSSTDKALIGQAWQDSVGASLVSTRQDVRVFESAEGDDSVYVFESPIHFNNTRIGSVNVSISQSPLIGVMSVTKRVLFVLGVSVTLVVLLAAFFLNRLVARNLLLVRRTIADYGEGNFNARISNRWKNEFGAVASAFNSMAENLQLGMHNDESNSGQTEPLSAGADIDRELVGEDGEDKIAGGEVADTQIADDTPQDDDLVEEEDPALTDSTIVQVRPGT